MTTRPTTRDMANARSKLSFYIEGIGLLAGMIIGAGIFALPFAINKSGVFWGLLHFLVALFLVLVLHLLYGEMAYLTPGKHRFTGYVRQYLGLSAERFAFLLTVFGYYGSLLAYGILGGIFLKNILSGTFPSVGVFELSMIFFAAASVLSVLRFEKIGTINFYLTIPILLFIVYLVASSWGLIDHRNFAWSFNFNDAWFLPYGVWIFALSGFSIIPEVRDVMHETTLHDFKIVVVASTLIAAVFSLIFAFGVLGITGTATSEDALSGLAGFLGHRGIVLGSIIGFLAVFTSYLATIADFKELLRTDYGVNIFAAWAVCIIPPMLAFAAGLTALVSILSFVGAASMGVSGILILGMASRVPDGVRGMLRLSKFSKWFIGIAVAVASVYETWSIIVK